MKYLLIGGQACILYGAAEFSRDTDIVVLADPDNIRNLQSALDELQASNIVVPTLSLDYLRRGHAIHFRCGHPDVMGIRIDVLSVMRGVDEFTSLWERRTTMDLGEDGVYELISLPDLITSKKTQRDKDWPMIRRLVEAHHAQNSGNPNSEQISFWFRECRTPLLLIVLASKYTEAAIRSLQARPLLEYALKGDEGSLIEQLEIEEKREREADRAYWIPLRRELEELRHQRITDR